ncbi:MAG: hypothetical protein WA728_03335 [Xanthobacteraceae bacterium]
MVGVPFTVKVTVPVGVPVAGGRDKTVTVKVTDWPNALELCDDVIDVCDPPPLTLNGVDIELLLKLASPLYVAVIVRLPVGSAVVVNVACASPVPGPATAGADPIVPMPSENVTVPVGVPVPVADAMVTLKVTD